MYRIATNACLTALDGQQAPADAHRAGPAERDPHRRWDRPEVGWLEPLPDSVVWGGRPTTRPARW